MTEITKVLEAKVEVESSRRMFLWSSSSSSLIVTAMCMFRNKTHSKPVWIHLSNSYH